MKKTPTKAAPKAALKTAPTTSWKKPIIAVSAGVLIIAAAAGIYFYSTKPMVQKPVVLDTEIVATVNGKTISLADVRAFAQSIPQTANAPFEAIYPQLLDAMINARIVYNAAETSGVENNDNVKKALKMAREQILSQAYIVAELEKMMTDEKLQEIYVKEIRNFPKQDEIKARHILVATKDEADAIEKKLKSGADFAKLADEKSISPEKNGGELGYFTKPMMVPEFSEPVFKMKKGDVSEPIKTPFGWHIVKVEDRRTAQPPKFDAVKGELQQAFAAQNIQSVVAAERAKQTVDIKVPAL